MLNYLTNLDQETHGKRKLLLIYYALKSRHTNNNVIFDYLTDNFQQLQQGNYFLQTSPFKYTLEVQRVVPLKTFWEYNSQITPSKKRRVAELRNKSEDEVRILFDNLEIDTDSMLSSKMGTFIWLTKSEPVTNCSINLAYELGLCYPNEHLVTVTVRPNDSHFDLFLPTLIEAGEENFWFYPNPDATATWGLTINISSIQPDKTEQDIEGLPEALSKPIKLSNDSTAVYLGKMKNEQYFNDRMNNLHHLIEHSFFNPAMQNDVIEAYKTYAGIQ